MSAVSLQVPDSLQKQAKKLAKKQGISVDQLVSSALAEKLAALMQPDYLEQKAKRGSRERYLAALAQVPDVAPDVRDEPPSGHRLSASRMALRERRRPQGDSEPPNRGPQLFPLCWAAPEDHARLVVQAAVGSS